MKSVDLKKMRLISIVWGLVLFLMVFSLTTFGFYYKKQTKAFKDFEKKLTMIVEEYTKEKALLDKDDLIITIEELKEENKIETRVVNEKVCEGYVVVTYKNEKYTYSPYIKCGKYKTKNYKS